VTSECPIDEIERAAGPGKNSDLQNERGKSRLLPNLVNGAPPFTVPILVLVATEQCSGSEVEGRMCPSGQSVGVSTLDVRSDLFHRQRADRPVTAENVDIVVNEADGADSGIISASAFAFEFGEN
jgi:hypothetical protein